MRSRKKHISLTDKKWRFYIIIALMGLLIVAAIVVTYFILISTNENKSENSNNEQTTNSINYDNATDEQKSAGEQIKSQGMDSLLTENESTQNGKKTVGVFIIDASQYSNIVEIRSYVNDLDPEGICTILLQNGSSVITKTTTTLPNASNSSCKTVDIPLSEFSNSGLWSVKVSYQSDSASGESNTINLSVTK